MFASAHRWHATSLASVLCVLLSGHLGAQTFGISPSSVSLQKTVDDGLIKRPVKAPQQRFVMTFRGLDHTRFSPSGGISGTGKISDRVPDRVAQVVSPVGETLRLTRPFDIIQSTTFATEAVVITLAGVTGPEADAVCINSQNHLVACGRSARAALNNTLGKEDVTCVTITSPYPERVTANCRTKEGDLAELLTRQGWLQPEPPQRPELQAAMEQARKAGAGMWDGGWRLR